MAAAPAAGAETGVGLAFVVALYAAFMFVVMIGLKRGWHDTLGSIFYAIGGVGISAGFGPKIHPFGFLKDLADTVENKLGDMAKGYEQAMGFWFHNAARLQGWIADELWKVSRDSYHFGGWLVHSFIPARIHDATSLLSRTVHATTKVVHRVETRVVHVTKTVYVTAHAAALPVAKAAAKAVALPVPLNWPWRVVLPKIGRLEKDATRLGRRVHRLEGLLGAAAFAALMANVLGVTGKCLRPRGPVGKTARKLCGLSTDTLNDLLGLIADVVIFTDICKVIELLNDGLSVIEGPLEGFVSVVGGALCHGDFGEPPALNAAPLSLPPVTGLALSLG